MLMDIGTEELSHLEMVGTLARMHLKPMKKSRDSAEADPLTPIAGGKWKIVESPELEQGVEGQSGETIAKNHKPVSEATGKTRVKKSA